MKMIGNSSAPPEAACDASPPSHSALLYILSVDSPANNKLRCYHRALHQQLGVHNGVMSLRADESHVYHLRLFYVLDAMRTRSAEIEAEMAGAGRRDVLELPDSSTCLPKVIACLRHAAGLLRLTKPLGAAGTARGRRHRHYDSVVIGDDDAVIHPQRFVLDMAEAADP